MSEYDISEVSSRPWHVDATEIGDGEYSYFIADEQGYDVLMFRGNREVNVRHAVQCVNLMEALRGLCKACQQEFEQIIDIEPVLLANRLGRGEMAAAMVSALSGNTDPLERLLEKSDDRPEI